MKSGFESLAQLATPDLADARLALLVVLLMLAAFIDVRTFRIPNWLTYGGAVIGLVLGTAIQWRLLGPAWAADGLLWSLGGLAAGLALMLPMYALRVMGAGDVKLMAMAGAFLGLGQIVPAVLCVFVAGGVLAVGYALWRRAFGRMTANVVDIVQSMAFAAMSGVRAGAPRPSVGNLPYGVSISAGTIAWVVLSQA
ncbi:prepilin peptidase [Ramlibacter sp. RBP-2]|uniref:Prepilin peptidase n=1 Tax=Ramlibacter lithotrophicus TaxID=2606681 RepID=A0A7X6DF47_9BURK|nr:A24 family peptidase [Ramlibacter lithotrophicus]NKE66034.1 prepilin peptidase [Ramlibacter lithotrophicus]